MPAALCLLNDQRSSPRVPSEHLMERAYTFAIDDETAKLAGAEAVPERERKIKEREFVELAFKKKLKVKYAKYKDRKKAAVVEATRVVALYPDLYPRFCALAKKDDVADAILQTQLDFLSAK